MSIVYVIRPEGTLSHEELESRLRRALATRTGELSVAIPPPLVSTMPFRRSPMALASLDTPPAPAPGLVVHAYRVETSMPVDGDIEGFAMITLFRRKKGLDDEELLRRWHEGHSSLAVRIHPLTRYVRHVVVEALHGAPPLDGIVIEQVREKADILRPWRFFGSPLSFLPNLVRVSADAAGFIDLLTIENQLAVVERLSRRR